MSLRAIALMVVALLVGVAIGFSFKLSAPVDQAGAPAAGLASNSPLPTRIDEQAPPPVRPPDGVEVEPVAPEPTRSAALPLQAAPDDGFGPVDEEGAADDFDAFGDGPVETFASEPEAEAACRPLDSRCRRDAECCGTSVCRSRPGTIAGHAVCSPG